MILRRTLLGGLLSSLAAPAIVRASSLMPVKAWIHPPGIVYPSVLDRIPVMINGAIRYLLPTDTRQDMGRQMRGCYCVGPIRPVSEILQSERLPYFDMSNHSARDGERQAKLLLVTFE